MQYAGITKVDSEFVGPFCYRRFDERYLLTNDLGYWHFLVKDDFKAYVEGTLAPEGEPYTTLKEKGFIHGEIALENALKRMRRRYSFLQDGPTRHTLGLTSVAGANNMSLEVGERAIDMAFISTAQDLEIIFAGGLGNFNWDVLTALTDFATNKNRLARKNVAFTLRGDLGTLDETQRQWLLDHDFRFEADLDSATLSGEETPLSAAVKSLNEALKAKEVDHRVCARVAPSEEVLALGGGKVADAVAGLGCQYVELQAARDGEVGVSAETFGAFYRDLLARVITLDENGQKLREKTAAQFLTRILEGCEGPASATRSPSTDGIGELAYGWEGTVFTTDEGRFIGEGGDPIFALGNVVYDGYHDLMTHPTVRAVVLASIVMGQPGYASWVYRPFCGPRPSRSYIEQGSLQGRAGDSSAFLKNQGILDELFRLLGDEGAQFSESLKTWSLA
jgi:hypothetical protein